ncbi:MAG: TonB-dependent receptor [Bacteroidales bacterium]|nr:TonB-dependent receptor [Bacteroidales bacterium]
MRQLLVLTISLLVFFNLNAQHIIKGIVTDSRGDAVVGAVVYIKDTYTGTNTDSLGRFKLEINNLDVNILIISLVGYKPFEKQISNRPVNQQLNIKLKESTDNINAVIITAGAFDASDEKKSITMRPLDIVTTASGEGDIYGALNTMPGTQKVGEEGGLFVRGGEGYETKTYMDGMLVQKPYSSSMPDVPARGRFSPFLFGGTVFSTGGYSAEYGQALSSALILNTKDLADGDITSISLLSVGANASHTKRWNNTSVSLTADYSNLSPYFKLIEQDIDWLKSPESYGGNLIFRQKINERGMIKTFGSFSRSESHLLYPNYEIGENQLIKLFNDNGYMNTVYTDMLSSKLKMKIGLAYNSNTDDIDINENNVETKEFSYQSVLNFKYLFNNDYALKFGAEIYNFNYNQDYFDFNSDEVFNTNFENTICSSFAETELKLSSKFAGRIGSRFEYSSLSKKYNISPRISLAVKTGKFSQLSFAYGIFYQAVQNDYVKFNNDLNSEKATHYIANYQLFKKDRTFRIEAYYKDYKDLIKYQAFNLPVKDSYNNSGYGYSKGFDIFWRDRKTFNLIDYRVSYSFLDTERDYLNYQNAAVPTFSSKHNFAFVYKHWITKLTTYLGLTYSYSSGRTYYNPNNSVFLDDITKDYHDLSFNASYLTTVFGNSAIIHFSVSNLLGIENVYGYRYSSQMNENMAYEAHPVKPSAKRFAVLVFMLSIK